MLKIVIKISPNYDSSKMENATIEDLVNIFEDRLFGWHLNWADVLNKEEHAGFAVLQLVFAYFESIKIYQTGKSSDGNSKKYFKESLVDVFPELLTEYDSKAIENAIELIYKDARCGFYHSGMAKKRIILHDTGKAIRFDTLNGDVIAVRIDRHKFVEIIKGHAHAYISQVRNPNSLEARDKFLKGWNIFHG